MRSPSQCGRSTSSPEKEIHNTSKGKIVSKSKFERKSYTTLMPLSKTSKVLRLRLAMTNLPANFKDKGEEIYSLCNGAKGDTGHYLECEGVCEIRKIYELDPSDLISEEVATLHNLVSFFEKVEILVGPLTMPS